MSKPTLQEVKEYFKNAKIVDGLISKFDISTCLHTLEYSNKQYWVNDDGSFRVIWDKQLGYTKIISYKEPLYQLTSKEIVNAYENPQYLKDTFKECFETELEVNRWYIRKHNRKCIINFQLDNNKNYGFGAAGNYSVGWQLDEENSIDFEPATEKEVEEALVKEAIKIGYKKGVKCKFGKIKDERVILSNSFEFVLNQNKLAIGNDIIFHDGDWAEIIQVPTYTIAEAEEKFNIKIKTEF